MNMECFAPEEIEARSFEIITRELDVQLDNSVAPVVKRVIHATADFDFARNLYFSPGVVEVALEAIRSGVDIVCDTNMAKSGINRTALEKLGIRVHCFMADPDVAEEARNRGVTRAAVCMERAEGLGKPLIFAIGNAPTALIRLSELYREDRLAPRLVVAAPVGFVNVVESKEIAIDIGFPVIAARGRKGGSSVAAAICNALLYQVLPK